MADYLNECNQGELRTDAKGFQEVWCARCRKKDCTLANWSGDKFEKRTAGAMDRLFNNVNQGDLNVPKFALISALDFPDLTAKVMRLEASAKANDWNIPEIPITDGRIVTAEQDTTDHVDEAIRKLAEAEGRNPQDAGLSSVRGDARTQNASTGTLAFSDKESEIVSNHDDHEAFHTGPPDVPEGPPDSQTPLPAPSHPKAGPIVRPKRGNTEMPSDVMVSGDPVKAPPPAGDPWAAPKRDQAKRVRAGATIQFGTGGVIDDT